MQRSPLLLCVSYARAATMHCRVTMKRGSRSNLGHMDNSTYPLLFSLSLCISLSFLLSICFLFALNLFCPRSLCFFLFLVLSLSVLFFLGLYASTLLLVYSSKALYVDFLSSPQKPPDMKRIFVTSPAYPEMAGFARRSETFLFRIFFRSRGRRVHGVFDFFM